MSLASVISETSVSREKEERRKENTERMRMMRETMRACMRARVCLVVESVIDLFREEAGISGLREGSVEEEERGKSGEWGRVKEEERERERGNLSRRGRERRRGKRRKGRRDDGRMDGRTGRYHTCARTRRSGLLDGQRTNDRVLLRVFLECPSYPEKEKEKERKRKNRSRDEALGSLCYAGGDTISFTQCRSRFPTWIIFG